MKKCKSVTLGIVSAVAAALLSACSEDPAQVSQSSSTVPPTHQKICVDKDNKVVEDDRCTGTHVVQGTGQPTGPSGQVAQAGNSALTPFLWYYILTRPGGYPLGYQAAGGSYTAPAGARVATGRIVNRAGFGATAAGRTSTSGVGA